MFAAPCEFDRSSQQLSMVFYDTVAFSSHALISLRYRSKKRKKKEKATRGGTQSGRGVTRNEWTDSQLGFSKVEKKQARHVIRLWALKREGTEQRDK